MDKEQLDAIANRKTTCHPFGEMVSISRAEREELVALAKEGITKTSAMEAIDQMIELNARRYEDSKNPYYEGFTDGLDAALTVIQQHMAAEIGKNMENV